MTASPTARTLAECKRRGWLAQVVERWNPHARVRHDLFGFIDVLALDGEQTIGIQATSTSNLSSRLAKIHEHENKAAWLEAGNRILVWGWAKRKWRTKGGAWSKGGRWTLKAYEVLEGAMEHRLVA